MPARLNPTIFRISSREGGINSELNLDFLLNLHQTIFEHSNFRKRIIFLRFENWKIQAELLLHFVGYFKNIKDSLSRMEIKLKIKD